MPIFWNLKQPHADLNTLSLGSGEGGTHSGYGGGGSNGGGSSGCTGEYHACIALRYHGDTEHYVIGMNESECFKSAFKIIRALADQGLNFTRKLAEKLKQSHVT